MSSIHRPVARLAVFALAGLAALPAAANNFPTVERVLYVQECARNNPGPNFEMVNKCSCALDALAREISYDEYVSMTTITKAMTIGGERGNDLRDNETLKPELRRWRELQAKALKSCFVGPR